MKSSSSIKRSARNAVTSVKNYFPSNSPSPIVHSIAIKKLLPLNLLTINGSCWQTAEYHEFFLSCLETTERIIDIKVKIIEEKYCDINSKKLSLGSWDFIKNYSPEVISLLNKYGSKDRLTLLLCDEIENCQALAVLKNWAGKEDNLQNEGVILSPKALDNTLSQLLAKIFSNKIPFPTSDDPNNLLCPLNNGGEEWTELWRKVTQTSNYLT